jgi:hypothetical protein
MDPRTKVECTLPLLKGAADSLAALKAYVAETACLERDELVSFLAFLASGVEAIAGNWVALMVGFGCGIIRQRYSDNTSGNNESQDSASEKCLHVV